LDYSTAAIAAASVAGVFAAARVCFTRFSGPTSSGKLLRVSASSERVELRYRRLVAVVTAPGGGALRLVAAFSDKIPGVRSYAIVKPDPWPLTVRETDESVMISCGNCELRASRNTARFEICDDGQLVLAAEITRREFGREIVAHLFHGSSRFFGLGAKTGSMELSGRRFTLYNTDTYRYTPQTDPLYTSIPFFMGISGKPPRKGQPSVPDWAVFYDCPARSRLHFRDADTLLSCESRVSDITFFSGQPQYILARYTELTGRPPLPPLWALGFHQSRYSYQNREEAEDVVEHFRKEGIPLDVIYLDIGFLDRNRSFTVNRESFPEPGEMVARWKEQGVHAVLIVNPGVHSDPKFSIYRSGIEHDVFIRHRGRHFTGTVWPGECVFPDFTRPATQDWWTSLYEKAVQTGFDGFWNDMNEPSVFDTPEHTFPDGAEMDNFGSRARHRDLHNAYGISMVQATKNALEHYRPGMRQFILTRAGYSGIQRYAWLWTGDNSSNWEHLRMNVSMVQNFGISGVPFTGADIGGYSGEPSPELFTRWIQLGTFIPLMRDHTENGTPRQEPYVFREHLDTIRRYIRLRYRLIPYLYACFAEASRSGIPPVRPLFFEFGKDYLDEQELFMLGSSILVAPVLREGAEWMDVTLPGRLWYGLRSGKEYGGGRVTESITMEDIPVYVKGGAILPFFDGEISNTLTLRTRAVSLQVYPDEFGLAFGVLYEDDGVTDSWRNGQYLRTRIRSSIEGNEAFVSLETEGDFHPERQLRILLPDSVRYVNIDGFKLSVTNGEAVIRGEEKI
jgi:alpha-glucosidase